MAIERRVLDCFAALAMTLSLLLAAPAAAQTFPANNGSPVVDQAGILRPEQVQDLTSKAQALYAQSGRAFAVATVKSLEGYPVDDYAYRLGRYWKLGSAKNDDGVASGVPVTTSPSGVVPGALHGVKSAVVIARPQAARGATAARGASGDRRAAS